MIDDVSGRREALNIMLSMPRGADPLAVQRAAREFAQVELNDRKFVMVLHVTARARATRAEAAEAWEHIARTLAASCDKADTA